MSSEDAAHPGSAGSSAPSSAVVDDLMVVSKLPPTPRHGLPRIEPLSQSDRLARTPVPEQPSSSRRLLAAALLAAPSTAAWVLPAVLLAGNVSGPVQRALVGMEGAALAVVVVFALRMLPRVSFRRRDVLALLVPGWGTVLSARLGHRAGLLPFRDWPPRRDEMLRARKVRGHQLWVLTDAIPAGLDTVTPAYGIGMAEAFGLTRPAD